MSVIGPFLAMAAIGLAIGAFAGLVGVGGGAFMIPLFRLVLGLDPVVSTATSLFTIVPTSISGAVSHVHNHTCVPKLGVTMGVAGACLSPVGAWLANQSPGWLVILASAVCIVFSALRVLSSSLKGKRPGAGEVPPQPELSRKQLAISAVIGAVAGLMAGYVGLGGGFLLIPLMVALLDMPMKLTSGTSLVAVLMLAIPGTIMQAYLGNVDYLAGIATACGTIPGAFLGGRFTKRLSEKTLGIVFASFLLVAVVLMCAREFGLF